MDVEGHLKFHLEKPTKVYTPCSAVKTKLIQRHNNQEVHTGDWFYPPCFLGLVVLPCSLKSCTNNALCVFKSGSVECRCPDVNDCSNVSNPVCGSNGTTHKVYDNMCFMEAESCKMGKRISPVPHDKCGKCLLIAPVCDPWNLIIDSGFHYADVNYNCSIDVKATNRNRKNESMPINFVPKETTLGSCSTSPEF